MHDHVEYVDIGRIHIKTPWVKKLYYTNASIIELYEPGFGVKKFGGLDHPQSFLGCFWNDLQIHIKAEIYITNYFRDRGVFIF